MLTNVRVLERAQALGSNRLRDPAPATTDLVDPVIFTVLVLVTWVVDISALVLTVLDT